MGQYGLLNQMQGELAQENTNLDIRILGVNDRGEAEGNEGAVVGKTIPWLQDSDEVRAWNLWDVTWRDVFVLDADNQVVAIYNLTKHSLSRPSAYDSLKTMMREAAR